jgi:hypothetical protein
MKAAASYQHIPVKGGRTHPYHPNAPAHSLLPKAQAEGLLYIDPVKQELCCH